MPKCVEMQALMKSPDHRPGASELLSHPWLTPYTSQAPPTPASGPHTPRQTRESFHAQHQLHQPPGDHEQASDTLLQMSDLQDLNGVKRCAQQCHSQGRHACDWATDSCPKQQDSVPDQVKQTASVLGANQVSLMLMTHCNAYRLMISELQAVCRFCPLQKGLVVIHAL